MILIKNHKKDYTLSATPPVIEKTKYSHQKEGQVLQQNIFIVFYRIMIMPHELWGVESYLIKYE